MNMPVSNDLDKPTCKASNAVMGQVLQIAAV
jgi:hypothetical protein